MIYPVRLHLRKTGPLLIAAGLLVSCDTPQKHALRELTQAGIEPSGNALLQAAAAQDSQQVGWLLDVGVFTEQRDALGRTPVRVAIDNRDLASVFKLLDAKADVNATTADHVSVLGVAVACGETAITAKLLTAGARPDGLVPDGEKILPRAADLRAGDVEIRCRPSPQGSLGKRAAVGGDGVRPTRTRGHADPGATNLAGETTLPIAFRHGWLDTVPMLAAAGANPNTPFNLPVSPAFLKNVRPGVMRWVLKNDRNVTPLLMAADSSVISTAHDLTRAGDRVNIIPWPQSVSGWRETRQPPRG